LDEPARKAYEAGSTRSSRAVEACEARSRAIGTARLVTALGAVALCIAMAWAPLPRAAWIGVAVLVVVFAALVVQHGRVIAQRDRFAAALRFHARGIARLDGKWHDDPSTGESFSTPNHPYAGDLDVFGRASLFQLLDATETRTGAQHLAAWLKGAIGAYPSDVHARQDAVRDLAPRLAFREQLAALGAMLGGGGRDGESKPDPGPFLAWAEGETPLDAGPFVTWFARLFPIVTVSAIAFSRWLPSFTWVGLVVLQLVVTAQARARVAKIAASVTSRERGLVGYAELIHAVEVEPFDADLLKAAQRSLHASGASATAEMAALGRILSFLEARQNEVFRAFIGPLLLWDLNCVLFLEKWRLRAGARARTWLEALGQVEALASLAGFAFERPDHAWPELAGEPRFVATALGHPLIGTEKRVANDVALDARGRALVVTGSNMSGKSTLLRAMGINAVLALAGAPVCASRLAVGDLRLVTSMRVRDSLEEGVSHFYAELQRLKMVIDMARGSSTGSRAVFFLLDEILHGTNTRERLIGARAIVRELVAMGALGAVSTHDLGIGDLETELDGQVKNVHFEEQVDGERMTFDYRLRGGIVQSSNALRLMKIVGIDIV